MIVKILKQVTAYLSNCKHCKVEYISEDPYRWCPMCGKPMKPRESYE